MQSLIANNYTISPTSVVCTVPLFVSLSLKRPNALTQTSDPCHSNLHLQKSLKH